MKLILAIVLAATMSVAAAQGVEGTYRVRSGESLAAIANALIAQEPAAGAEKPSVAQRMVAIYRANPKAFAGSMNQLLDGAELRLPSPAEIAAVNPALARIELAGQTSEYLASKPRSTDPGSDDPAQVAQASDEQVIAGLQKALRRKERELAALRIELEGRRELLPSSIDGTQAGAAPGMGQAKAGDIAVASPGISAQVAGQVAGRATGQVAQGVFSPNGLAVAGAVSLLGGLGLLWYLRGRGRGSRGVIELTEVTEVVAASNSVAEAEVMRRMPDLSGFSGLGSATPRARDPNA